MTRRRREKAILSLISEGEVRTQAELAEALRRRGIEASQSTISRDIKRLGLVKLPAEGEGYRYARPEKVSAAPSESRLREAVVEFVTGVAEGSAILALTTPPGGANALAAAIDGAGLEEVAATLAGDDTVFLLTRGAEDLEALRKRLEAWL